jgi:hypothetical protein
MSTLPRAAQWKTLGRHGMQSQHPNDSRFRNTVENESTLFSRPFQMYELEAYVYLWAGPEDALDTGEWDFTYFERERLEDWLALFGGMEMSG